MSTTELKQSGLVLEESSAPTAEDGTGVLYVKSDGKLYFASDGGSGGDISETQLNNQGSSAVVSASTGVYTPQIGPDGDDDLIGLAANTASINGDLFLAAGGKILMADNTSGSLRISQGANDYIVFSSTDDEEFIEVKKEMQVSTLTIPGNTNDGDAKQLVWPGSNYRADMPSGSIGVTGSSPSSGPKYVKISGSQGKGIIVTGSSEFSSTLTVASAVSASGFYVGAGGQIGVAADDDLLSLKSGHFHVSGTTMAAVVSGTTATFTLLSASQGVYAPQIGVSGDDDLLALSSGLLTVNAPVSASGFYVGSGGQIGVASDDDLLSLTSGHFHVSGNLMGAAMSGTTLTSTAISASLGLYTPQIGLSGDDDLLGLASGELTVNGGLTVTGDMTVAGTTSVVNSTNLHVKDPLILLNSGNVTIGNDIGLIFQRSDDSGTSGTENRASKGFIWDESADVFAVIACNAESGTTAGNVTISSYAPFVAGTLSGTTATLTAASCSLGVYTPQIGLSGDDDLMALSSGLVTVNGVVSSSGFYATQIGLSGDDDLLTLASGKLTVAGALTASTVHSTAQISGTLGFFTAASCSLGIYAPQIGLSGDDDLMALSSGLVTVNGNVSASNLYVSSGGQVGVAGDDDLLVLKPGHFHCSGNFFATAVSGTSIDCSDIAISSELHVDSGSVKIVAPINISGRTTTLAALSGATWDGAFGVFISGSNMGDSTGHYNFAVGVSSSMYSVGIHTNMGIAFSPGYGVAGTAKNTPYFKIFDAPQDNLGNAAGTAQYETTVLSCSKGVLIYGRANDDGYHLELPNTASARAKSWATYSSAKYKKNIVEMDTANALDKVLTMRGVNYEWNVGNEAYSPDVGFIAEEMAEVVPEVVKLDADGEATSIDYSRLTSVIVEAMKEQQNQIEDLKQTIVYLQDGKQVKAKVGKIKIPTTVQLKEKTSDPHQEIDAPEMFLDENGVWQTKE